MDAQEDGIHELDQALDDRFACKDIETLPTHSELDYLGLQLFQTNTHTGFYLEKYIIKTLQILNLHERTTTCPTPIIKPIDGDSKALTDNKLKLYPTAVGCLGWMANTCRPDISYAHSRMSRHLANPTESAWEAVIRCCNYLRGTTDMCIAAPIYLPYRDPHDTTRIFDRTYG